MGREAGSRGSDSPSGVGRVGRDRPRGVATAIALAGLLAWALAFTGCGERTPGITDCLPRNGLKPICLFRGPEDLAVVGRWLVVSQMPTREKPGNLIAFHPGTRTFRKLYPPASDALGTLPAAASVAPAGSAGGDAHDAGCAAGQPPPFDDFAPHGIDAMGTRLLVINHGRREAIEEFEISLDATGLVLVWKSCTRLPEDASANDVVALEDGGFAASKMLARPLWRSLVPLLLGMDTGALLRFDPKARTWSALANSAGRAPNGVEVDAEGRFWMAEWRGGRLVRLSPDGSSRESVELDFSPDNLAWAPDGRLLVAGQRGGLLELPRCATTTEGSCSMPSVVVAVDPGTLAVELLVDEDPATVIGAASIAVELEGKLYIGSFAGNRLVERDLGRQGLDGEVDRTWKRSSSNVP